MDTSIKLNMTAYGVSALVAVSLLLSLFPAAFLQAAESPHHRLGFHKVCLLDGGGMRLTVSNYNPESYEVTYKVAGTNETDTFTVAGATETEGAFEGMEYKRKVTTFNTENDTEEGEVSITYNNGTEPDTLIRRAKGVECEDQVATLEITKPGVAGKKLDRAPYTFKAEYVDNDATVDAIQWAIRKDVCTASTNTKAGNVDGKNNPSTFSGTTFKALVDMSSWVAGEYCFVVNPKEQSGEPDLRATRMFNVKPAQISIAS